MVTVSVKPAMLQKRCAGDGDGTKRPLVAAECRNPFRFLLAGSRRQRLHATKDHPSSAAPRTISGKRKAVANHLSVTLITFHSQSPDPF
jgi:hypothetical protein